MSREIVLGLLLKLGAMSGYEIQQKMQSAQANKWADAKSSSVYLLLRKLDKENLIALQTLEQTGNRSKAIYKITPKGCEIFKQLLIEAFSKPSVFSPAALYTGLSFMDEINRKEILKALEQHESAILNLYEEMKIGHTRKTEHTKIPVNIQFIFENIYDHCELQLTFLKHLKEELFSSNETY